MNKKLFTIGLTYFDSKGQWVRDAELFQKFRVLGDGPNMNDVVSCIRGLQRAGGQMGMPGGIDEGFIGFVLVEHEYITPRLIIFN